VPELIRNFTGQAYETVDFRNKIFKLIYHDVYPAKEEELIALLQEQDNDNFGLINEAQLLTALKAVVKSVPVTDLERLVRYLEKDKLGKLNYMEFIQKMCKVSNRNHNPFKSIISRISFFLKQNSISIGNLLKRLAIASDSSSQVIGIPIRVFAEFLKQKVEKKKDLAELERFTTLLDVDKDGLITEADLLTCIKNLNNAAFYKNSG
jgi:Ca2+-binding EF-hand superfamily protein